MIPFSKQEGALALNTAGEQKTFTIRALKSLEEGMGPPTASARARGTRRHLSEPKFLCR